MQQEKKTVLMEKGKVGEKQMMRKREEEAKADNDRLTSSKCINSDVDIATVTLTWQQWLFYLCCLWTGLVVCLNLYVI